MLPKMTSQELNDILINSQMKIKEIDDNITVIKNDISDKLFVIRHESEYISKQLQDLANGAYSLNEGMYVLSNMPKDKFEVYGSTVHSSFIKQPINIFNLQVSGTGEIFFRDDVKVLINKEEKESYKSILSHSSSKDKQFFCREFNSNELTIEIIADQENALGSTLCNVIEINPFLPGSFDIKKLTIFGINSEGETTTEPIELSGIERVGQSRIVLPNKIEFHKIEMSIVINHSSRSGDKAIYPFGLKHIYLYDADFKQDSFVVVPIKTDEYISIIKDKIMIKDITSNKMSTIEEEEIELYLEYNNGIFDTQVYSSTPTERREIAKNTKVIYAKIPLLKTKESTKEYRSLIGIGFNTETRV
jgi:hypothetical protein